MLSGPAALLCSIWNRANLISSSKKGLHSLITCTYMPAAINSCAHTYGFAVFGDSQGVDALQDRSDRCLPGQDEPAGQYDEEGARCRPVTRMTTLSSPRS